MQGSGIRNDLPCPILAPFSGARVGQRSIAPSTFLIASVRASSIDVCLNGKPASSSLRGSARALERSTSSAIRPKAMRKANAGTAKIAGRCRRRASACVNSRLGNRPRRGQVHRACQRRRVQNKQSCGDQIGQADPAHPLLSGAKPSAEAEPEDGKHARQGSVARIEAPRRIANGPREYPLQQPARRRLPKLGTGRPEGPSPELRTRRGLRLRGLRRCPPPRRPEGSAADGGGRQGPSPGCASSRHGWRLLREDVAGSIDARQGLRRKDEWLH